MRNELVGLLNQERASLTPCPSCPVKGACVFVTPGYEPGYCLHEYKLLHAFLAQRLRATPRVGASHYSRLAMEASRFVDRVRRDRPFDESQSHAYVPIPLGPAPWPHQRTLDGFS